MKSPQKTTQTLRLKLAPQPLPIPEPTTVDALLQAGGVAGTGFFMARWKGGAAQNGDLSALRQSLAVQLPTRSRPRFFLVICLDCIGAPVIVCIDRNGRPRPMTPPDERQAQAILTEWPASPARPAQKELLRAA